MPILGFVLCALLFALCCTAEAQQTAHIPHIGILRTGSPPDPLIEAFVQGLRELNYIDGTTIALEYRWAEGQVGRLSEMAADLVRQLEYLPWYGRADTFDTYFLRQAEAMLRPKGLTELISGERPGCDSIAARVLDERATRFATWSRAIVSAVLLELAERFEVGNPHQALTYMLSGDLRLAKAGALWTAEHGMAPVERALRELPGYALVLLAASPNDTAERFMARDAFWAAVMKRT